MKLFLQSLGGMDSSESPPLFDSLLQMPKEIYGVVGDTLQIYYNAMVVNPYLYSHRVTCPVGDDLLRYYELIPTVAGTYTFQIELLAPDYSVITTYTSTLIIKEAVQQPTASHEFWTIGDSLTEGGIWTGEMFRRLTGTGGTPSGNAFGNITTWNEGNSGKSWYWYVNDEASPFVYSGVLNLEQYRIDNSLAVPKSIYILMTWNGINASFTQAQWDNWTNDVYTFIDAIKSAFPSCDVILMNPQMPSLNGGLGDDYGATGENYSNLFFTIIQMKKQSQIYSRITGEVGYDYVNHIDTSLQVDSLYNMPDYSRAVNTRNSTETEVVGSNGVHPATDGQYQIADSSYRHFIGKYCQ